MTTERGILFQGELVLKILSGEKTETRRLMRIQPEARACNPMPWGKPCTWLFKLGAGGGECFTHRFGVPGDTLWVRETWAMIDGLVRFRADYPPDFFPPGGWKVAIHLRRADARIDTELVSVHPEPLLEIDEGGAQREGLGTRAAFLKRWDVINWGTTSHHHNPWVWVIKFK